MAVNELWVNEDLQALIGNENPFTYFLKQDGEVFRALENRRTFAVELANKRYFIKYHRGVGSGEIMKNLVRGRLPVISARNEYRVIRRLRDLGISVPVIAAFGVRGFLPWTRESFIVTEDVGTQEHLEDYTRDWTRKRPAFHDKQSLLTEVVSISRLMHDHQVCHRDYYLCHFMMAAQGGNRLTVLDLHRALVKRRLAQRWVIKDVAALYFSAMDIGLTQRDLFRFMRQYTGKSLGRTLSEDSLFWQAVDARARRLKGRHG